LNLTFGIKRFLKNKNTVTIVGVVLIIAILYFGYNYQLSRAITPIKNIPVASRTLQPRTKITREDITNVDIAPILLVDGVIRNENLVIGQYVAHNTVVPEGSLFYDNVVVDFKSLPDSSIIQVKEGHIPYNFPVDMEKTYGNSMFPGNVIDIYMKAVNDGGQIMVGRLVENIEILAVKDSAGLNVFENTEERRVPSTFIFGVTPEIHILMRKASFMSNFSVELFPVPRGGEPKVVGDIQVSAEELRDFINANTVNIQEETPTQEVE
jgi:Flp pilus assembly protein CpaB